MAGLTCLVIEDEPFFREQMAAVLEKSGYAVTAPPALEELLPIFEESVQFDLVLFDGTWWPGSGWLEFRQEVLAAVRHDDGWLIGISNEPKITQVAGRLYKRAIPHAGKDIDALRVLIHPAPVSD